VSRRRATSYALLAVMALLWGLLSPVAVAHDVTCAAPQRSTGEWPMFGNDVSSTRHQPTAPALNAVSVQTLTAAWTFDARRVTHQENNEITGYPVVADGCVFFGSSAGNTPEGAHLPGWLFAVNADDGDVVWKRQVPGGVYSTVAVADGVLYAFVSRVSSPLVVALDAATGSPLWSTVVDRQFGADAVSSPIVHEGLLWIGVSGTAAEGNPDERNAFQGSSVLLATRSLEAPDERGRTRTYRAGQVVRKIWSIPPSQWSQGFAGGAQWGTVAIDPQTQYGFVGTGNPFSEAAEHAHTNAVLKLDLDGRRPTFGQIVASYKGDVEAYVEGAGEALPCDQGEVVLSATGAPVECGELDLDFGATPNIVQDASGRTVLVIGQKSGVVHVIDAATMTGVASVRLGVPSPVGGMVGSGATDGRTIYGSHTVGGYLYALDTTARPRWVAPVADGIHWGPPVTLAGGMVMTVDLKGFLDIYDAGTGAPLVHRPLQLGSDSATLSDPPLSWGGVAVARNTVFVSVGVGLTSAGLPSMPNGFVIAYRPTTVPVSPARG
jgi:polyvinyl alcohol dehydrogenase (cytochrome)